MKKILFFGMAICAGFNGFTQDEELNFESFMLTPDTAWYGQDQVTDGDTTYQEEIFTLELNYNAGWQSSSGWAISNETDNVTPGYTNSYSAITGEGNLGSDNYGICYVSQWNNNRIFFDSQGAISHMYVTNSTYAYWSMKDGDAFGKPFGADTNAQGVIDGTNGEDWFLLTIYGLDWDSTRTGDSVNFYLADYRFADNNDDYIVDSWELVDLFSLQYVWGLDFVLTSSDTGSFGMNTPAYFAMDDLTFIYPWSIAEDKKESIDVFPNPTNGSIQFQTEPTDQYYQVYSANGSLLLEVPVTDQTTMVDLSSFENGIYLLTIVGDGTIKRQKVIKQ